jgi:hypothetical protein
MPSSLLSFMTSEKTVFLGKLNLLAYSRNALHSRQPEVSVKHIIDVSIKLTQILTSHLISFVPFLILSFYLWKVLRSGSFPSGLPNKSLRIINYNFRVCCYYTSNSSLPPWPDHLIMLRKYSNGKDLHDLSPRVMLPVQDSDVSPRISFIYTLNFGECSPYPSISIYVASIQTIDVT